MKRLGDGAVPDSRQTLDKAVAAQGPGVPVTAFVFVERVADGSVIAVAANSLYPQPFFNHPFHHQMGSDLVFDRRLDLIAVDVGEREFAAPRPGTEKQTALISGSESRALGIGKLAQVMLEVVLVDGPEMASDLIGADDLSESAHPGHPKTENAVGTTSAPVLLLGTLPATNVVDIILSA